jgi:hypothetical protein
LRGGEVQIGLIADIHGKLFAVEIDLAELVKEDLDDLICLGDVTALGPASRM